MFFYVCSIFFLSLVSRLDCSEHLYLDQEFSVEVNLLTDNDDTFNILDQFFYKPVFVEKIEYKPDIKIATSELNYLTDFEENTWLTLQDIKKACWYLKKKNKFESVIFLIEKFNTNKKLTILLKSRWTFAKVKIKGSLTGKERYQNFYLFEHGEAFDLNKHQKSVEKIIAELKKEGYLKIKIDDHFDYDNNTKQINVILSLTNTRQFKINSILVDIKLQEGYEEGTDIVAKFKKKLEKRISDDLKNIWYSLSEIEKTVQNIKKYLVHAGYLHPVIKCKSHVLDKNFQVNLNFQITFFQKKSFIFQGNHFFSGEKLLDELLVLDTSILVIPPSLLMEDLLNLYKNNGFWEVSVDWKEEIDKYFFIIKEGPRAKVSNVKIKNEFDLLIGHEAIFEEFLKLDYFDAQSLKDCLNKLNLEYIQDGFWDFSITKQDYNLLHQHNYELIITIDQGKQRILSGIRIEGYPELIKDIFFSKWTNFNIPKPFDIAIVQEQKQWLLKYFKTQGYIDAIIKPELIETNSGLELRWIISNTENSVHFGKTIISGCSRIPNKIILRELCYKEGDIYDKSSLDGTIKRLKALNMFESVSVVPYSLSESREAKTVILSVVEDDPFEIKARFGVAQISKTFTNLPTATYKIGGSFLWKNPLNIADILRLDADLSRFSRNIAISYEMPWIFNHPIHTLIRGYSYQVGQPLVMGSNKKLYNENHDGFSLSFNRQYSLVQFNLTTGFDFLKVSGISPELTSVIQYNPCFIDKRMAYFYIEPSLILDKWDNSIDPINGSHTLISAKGFFPVHVKQANFIKINFEQAFLYPICYDITGAFRFRAGHIFNAQFDSIIPTERFYLGGPNTIRAYEPNMVPPINCFKCKDEEPFWVPVGGKSMLNINAEIRFPIYKKLSGVIFNDAGFLVENKISQISAKDLFGATGFGLRYITPLGPIRFDLGFKWKKRVSDDKPYAFYLTLGQAF